MEGRMYARTARLLLGLVMIGLLLAACGTSVGPAQRLNGTWRNETSTFRIDFNTGTFEGATLGQIVTGSLQILQEQDNTVVFKANDQTMTAQFQDDNTVLLSAEGQAPQTLTRVK
jgi:hypothetical protein